MHFFTLDKNISKHALLFLPKTLVKNIKNIQGWDFPLFYMDFNIFQPIFHQKKCSLGEHKRVKT